MQDRAPCRNHLAGDLILRGQASKRNCACLNTGRTYYVRYRVSYFKSKIASGNANDFLTVVSLFLRNNYLVIADQIVITTHSGCGEHVEPANHDGRRVSHEQRQAGDFAIT